MGSWFDNNIQKTHGPRISKEMAEALGVFDKAAGLRRKPDGSLEVLWSADTPKDQKTIQRHIQVEEVDSKIVLIQQDGQRLTFPDAATARAHLNEQLGDGVQVSTEWQRFPCVPVRLTTVAVLSKR